MKAKDIPAALETAASLLEDREGFSDEDRHQAAEDLDDALQTLQGILGPRWKVEEPSELWRRTRERIERHGWSDEHATRRARREQSKA